MKNQEITDLLESIKVVPAKDDSEGNTCCKMKVSDYQKIFQVLTLLKQQPTAGEFTRVCRIHLDNCGKGNYPQNTRINMAETTLRKACEIIDQLQVEQQPTAGEFTVQRYSVSNTGTVYLDRDGDLCLWRVVKDRLNSAEARIKELLEA